MQKMSLLIIALLISLFLMFAADVRAVENLILNGDFEEGEAGWLKSSRGAAAMQFIIDDKEPVSGKKSARFVVSNIGGGGIHDLTLDCDTPIRIKAGNTYTVDFWVKAEEDRTITIDFLMNHDPWTRVASFPVENIPVTKEWQVQHHTFKAEFSDNNMVFLFSFSRVSNKNPLVAMWIDRVRFYEGKYEEEALPRKQEPKAIAHEGKFTGSWGMIKSGGL